MNLRFLIAVSASFPLLACGPGKSASVGTIALSELCTTPGACSAIAIATFVTQPKDPPCTQTELGGGCTLTECKPNSFETKLPLQSAGTLTFEGSLADSALKLDFASSETGYTPVQLPQRPWNGGETLSVSATGAAVPAFADRSVIAPGRVEVTSPVCRDGKCGAISRSTPLTVTWTGDARTELVATLMTGGSGATPAVSLSCRFASSPGTISAETLARLPSGAASNTFGLTPVTSTTFAAGAWDVTLMITGAPSAGSFTPTN
jgi:hypothetical protein